MTLENYDKTKHYEMISSWYEARNQARVPADLLPETGFIAEKIAACFIYKTDSKLALIDCLITDPNSDKGQRDHALDALIEKLIEEAKNSKFKFIVGFTKLTSVEKRFKRYGFLTLDTSQTMIARAL